MMKITLLSCKPALISMIYPLVLRPSQNLSIAQAAPTPVTYTCLIELHRVPVFLDIDYFLYMKTNFK